MMHFRAGRDGISKDVYPDLQSFWDDLTSAYRVELGDMAANGCTYIQLDDISYVYLCDSDVRAKLTGQGEDPDAVGADLCQCSKRCHPRSARHCDHRDPYVPG